MKLIRLFPAWAWLVVSYVLLGAALYWSAIQPPNGVSGAVFCLSLMTSWLPAYIYANRRDMLLNKVFWISQSAGLIAAALVAVFIWPMLSLRMDAAQAGGRSNHWQTFLGAIGTWWLLSAIGNSIVTRAFETTEAAVEKRMSAVKSKPQTKAE